MSIIYWEYRNYDSNFGQAQLTASSEGARDRLAPGAGSTTAIRSEQDRECAEVLGAVFFFGVRPRCVVVHVSQVGAQMRKLDVNFFWNLLDVTWSDVF